MSRKKPQSAMAALLDFTEVPVLAETRISSDANLWDKEAVETTKANIMNSYTKAFVEQNTFSTEKVSSNDQLITVNPDDCVLWAFSDRPSDELGDIHALAESLKVHGQQEPILVRENRKNNHHKYEIIFGNRRWRAAQIAGIKLLAICKDVSDQQASLFQKEENENRKELSDYARAMSYRAQIDGGIYKNEAELSKFLCISKQALNDLMAYLRVPELLREGISNFKNLSKKMVTKLAALSKDKEILDVLIHLAPKISDQSITTSTLDKHIQSFLLPGVRKQKLIQSSFEKRNTSGELIFKTVLQNTGDVSLLIQRQHINAAELEIFHSKFGDFLKMYLQQEQ
ncbi:MAG: hypothetical protein A3E82_00505 [Gammaproteobacteria bacterium RIFCSPHIGHO2_12_FULL_38_11]|nr:MAG: hypothetical protein A3E82_00505 [Gammaproteobacteria bacterium RIFCSPHIGHO2_12_FULL_38_11]